MFGFLRARFAPLSKANITEWSCGYTVHCPHCNEVQHELAAQVVFGIAQRVVPKGKFTCVKCKKEFKF